MTFLMMDEEAIKYLKRKTKYFWKKETFGEFEKRQIPTKPRKKKDASDVYVIDLEIWCICQEIQNKFLHPS